MPFRIITKRPDYPQQSPSMLILATCCFAVSTPKQHEERALATPRESENK